jgi:hypothetical protein
MVESEAKELSEEIMLGAVMFGHRGFQPVIEAIIRLAERSSREPRDFTPPDETTTDRVRDDAIGELVQVSGLRVSAIRKRMFLRYRYKDGYGRIWFGLSPVSLALLSPRQTARGVRAGPVTVDGGFMPGGDFGKSVFRRRGRGRLPIDKQFYEIKDMGEDVIRNKVEPVIESIFKEELRDELLGAVSGQTRAKRRGMKRFR